MKKIISLAAAAALISVSSLAFAADPATSDSVANADQRVKEDRAAVKDAANSGALKSGDAKSLVAKTDAAGKKLDKAGVSKNGASTKDVEKADKKLGKVEDKLAKDENKSGTPMNKASATGTAPATTTTGQ